MRHPQLYDVHHTVGVVVVRIGDAEAGQHVEGGGLCLLGVLRRVLRVGLAQLLVGVGQLPRR